MDTNKQRLTGQVLQVMFNKKTTSFEVTDFVKTSKKQRSNVVEVQIKDIFQYNFIGLCIAHKKDSYGLNTSFLLRNTFDHIPYELNVGLFSPIIDSINIHPLIKKLIRIRHNKYYFLRKKPLPQSTIMFEYVVDMFQQDIEEEYIINLKRLGNNVAFKEILR